MYSILYINANIVLFLLLRVFMCFIKFILYFSLCALISRNFIMVLNIDVWGFFFYSLLFTQTSVEGLLMVCTFV